MAQGSVLIASPAPTAATFPLVEKLRSYLTILSAEVEFLSELHEPKRKFGRHREIIVAGRRCDHLFILCSGVVSRYKVLPDGQRQVLDLGLPRGFIGFPSGRFSRLRAMCLMVMKVAGA